MELLVMRHADAVDAGPDGDFGRVLSRRGREQAAAMGDWLKRIRTLPTVVVTSPLPRARETAEITAARLGVPEPVRIDRRLACGMTVADGLAVVHEYGDAGGSLLMVGHAPDVGEVVADCIGACGGVEMRKAAVACLRMEWVGHGGSVLRWLITPKEIS